MPTITAYVENIQANSIGNLATKGRISAGYESANTISSITFDVPIEQAREYYIGQKLRIEILPVKWEE